MKRHFKIILIIAILFQIVVCFTGEIVFTTGNKIGNMPALGDIDYDEKYEFIIMKETGDLLILNPETLEKFKDYMISNFIKKGDILVNKKDDTIYAVKIPFDDTSTITPFIFDINEDGIEDIIMIFNKSGKIIGLDYYNLYKNYQKTGKDIIKNNYIIWSNQIENDEITSGVSLFKKHGKYYIVFGSKQEHLYIINLKTGVFANNIDIHKFVSTPDRRMIRDSPLIYDINGDNFNDIIVGSNSGTIVALNGKTKTKLWTFSKKNSPVLFAPSVVKNNKTINLIVPFNEYKVVCLNAKTGREIWYYNTDASLFGAVTVADLNNDNTEEVLFATVDGFLTCLNSLNGEKLWTFKTSKVVATPIVYDFNQDLFGDIVLCDNNGIIQIINSKTHLPMDNYKFITKGLQEIASQPLIGDFTGNGIIDIALNSTDKNFYMFTDREKIEIEQWKIINVTEKGDLYRTGNISENKINNAKLKFYLNNIRKKNFYKAANDYLSEGNINLAAFNFKKVLDIDPEYKDTAEQFGKIVDKFLNYEYKSFQEALNQENLATAKKILNDVEKVSASYEKLDEMRTLLGKKLKDHKEARRLLEDGKKDIAAHLMIVGYKKLQQAKKLAPKNNLINAEIQKYIYEMNLYNEMLQDISDHKWGKAAEKYNKLFAKDPNFPGLTGYKAKITFNKNKFLILGGVLLFVALLMIMFFMLKKNKKKKEELMKQHIIENKEVIAAKSVSFEGEQSDEVPTEMVSEVIEKNEESTVTAEHSVDVSQEEQEEEEVIQETTPIEDYDESSIELGGIDLGVSTENTEPAVSEYENISEDEEILSTSKDVNLSEEPEERSMQEENLEVRMTMAIQLYEDEDYSRAKDEFKKILNTDSSYKYKTLSYLGLCYYALGETELSMKTIKKIPYQDNELPTDEEREILTILGNGFVKNNLIKPAIQVFKKLVGLIDGLEKKKILYTIANIYLDNGDKEEASKYYKELFLIDPNYKDVGDKLDELGFS